MPRAKILQIDRTDAMVAESAEISLSEAEREMAAFVAAAEELYGAEAGRFAADYWIEQVNSVDSSDSEWSTLRQVTVAAASRLAENTVEDPSNRPVRTAIRRNGQERNTRSAPRATSNERLVGGTLRPFVVSRTAGSQERPVEGPSSRPQLADQITRRNQNSPMLSFDEESQQLFDDFVPDPAEILWMTDGISHDMRNYLCAVYANAELLSQSKRSQTEREALLSDIYSAICSSIDMLNSLSSSFYSGHTHNFDLHSLNEVIARTVKMVRIHPDARTVDFAITDGPVLDACIDSRELGRAVYNLLLNACQAVSNVSAPRLVQISLREERTSIQIRVTDNGPGVPETTREILRRGLSTAEGTRGAGLGLTIAQCAAREHGGSLELEETTPGKTVFALHLSKCTFTPSPGHACP